MKLNETKIDISKLYFHGSSESRVTQLEAPSYEHPFYVTTDLHYAMAFCTKDSSSTGEWKGHSKKYTPHSQNFVYAVTLKPDCNVFDFRDKTSPEFKKFYDVIDKDIVDWVLDSSEKYDRDDIYEFIVQLNVDVFGPLDEDKTYDEYYERRHTTSGKLVHPSIRVMSKQLYKKCQKFIEQYGFQNAYRELDIHEIMAPLLKKLNQLGFQGICTSEHDSNDEASSAKVTTNYAIGIFDVNCLDILGLVPMKYEWLKKVNPSYLDNYSSESSYDKVKRFIQLYKQLTLKQQLKESSGRIQLKNNILEDDFKYIMSNAEVTNKHFNIEQFQKLYGQDYVWCALFDNGKCVVAAALLKNFGPEKGMTYVNELQSLVSGNNYGKKMLLALQSSYDKLWLMADASVKSDVLLRFYRNPIFNFTEHILPADESKYEVDTHVFAPADIADEAEWHTFLKQYFGNEEAVMSLSENAIHENKAAYLQKYRDEEDVIPVVDMFWTIRNKLSAPQNDIDWWIKKPFNALKDFVQSYDPSNKRQRRDNECRREMIDNGAKMLGSKDGYEIWYVPTYEAMRAIGRFYKGISTTWCVASDDPSFWFENHDMSEFVVLVRQNLQRNEFDKIAIEMQNGGRRFDVDDFKMWDVENEDDRFCNDELMHYAWELFVQNGERRGQYFG